MPRRRPKETQPELLTASVETKRAVRYEDFIEFALMLRLYGATISVVEVKPRDSGYVLHWWGGDVPPNPDSPDNGKTMNLDPARVFDAEVGF